MIYTKGLSCHLSSFAFRCMHACMCLFIYYFPFLSITMPQNHLFSRVWSNLEDDLWHTPSTPNECPSCWECALSSHVIHGIIWLECTWRAIHSFCNLGLHLGLHWQGELWPTELATIENEQRFSMTSGISGDFLVAYFLDCASRNKIPKFIGGACVCHQD